MGLDTVVDHFGNTLETTTWGEDLSPLYLLTALTWRLSMATSLLKRQVAQVHMYIRDAVIGLTPLLMPPGECYVS